MGSVFGTISEEQPKFEVLKKTDFYEIRKYQSCKVLWLKLCVFLNCKIGVAAETRYDPNGEDNGFWTLANYIGVFTTPKNVASQAIAMTTPVLTGTPESIAMTAPVITSAKPEAIAMTSPVVTEQNEQKDEVMAFLLPSKYRTVEECPVPTNPAVSLRQIPERINAVHRFQGFTDMQRCTKQVELLQEALAKDGVKITGPWQLARFNGPYTIYAFRTNEVSFPIEYASE
jgi:hypothetical protein